MRHTARAEAQDRMLVWIRDLACFGRAARLVWHKRRWRCVDPDCEARTWTETSPHISSRTVLTLRPGWEACRRVGANPVPWPVSPASSSKAIRSNATRYATGVVDLDRRMVIEMVEDNAALT